MAINPNDALTLLFDVEGGNNLEAGSGKRILDNLTSIVTQINKGRLPGVKVELDPASVTQIRNTLQSIFDNLKPYQIPAAAVAGSVKGSGGKGNVKAKQADSSADINKKTRQLNQQIATLEKYQRLAQSMQTSGAIFSKNDTAALKDFDAGVNKLYGDLNGLKNQNGLFIVSDANIKTLDAANVKLSALAIQYKQLEAASRSADRDMGSKAASMLVKLEGYKASFKKSQNLNLVSDKEIAAFTDVTNKIDGLIQRIKELRDPTNGRFIKSDENIAQLKAILTEYDNLQSKIQSLQTSLKSNSFGINAAKTFANATLEAENFYNRYKKLIDANEVYKRQWDEIRNKLKSNAFSNPAEAIAEVKKLEAATVKAGLTVESFSQKFRSALGDKLFYGVAAVAAAAVRRAFRQIYTDVVELQDAMSQFAIVTGATGDRLQKLSQQAYEYAGAINGSVTDLIDAATVYARLGFSDVEALDYAKLTEMYTKVGAVDISDAEDSITAMIKAFNLGTDDLQSALDKMVYVGNGFPISAAELGAGMNESAAALQAAGNSFEQSIGMLTAANTVTQNVAKAATALRTITARLRNSKAELEELGEDTSGLADSTAKYRKEIMALSGVDIMIDSNTFKSTYQIMDELSAKWEKLSDAQRAALTTLIAGTRQQSIFASLMENWDEATGAVNACTEAGDTLEKSYDRVKETVTAHIEELKTSFSEFANTVLNSDLVTTLLDIANAIVKISTALSDLGGGLLGKGHGINAILPVALGAFASKKGFGWLQNVTDISTGATKTIPRFTTSQTVLSNDDVNFLQGYNSNLKLASNITSVKDMNGVKVAAGESEKAMWALRDAEQAVIKSGGQVSASAKELAQNAGLQSVQIYETSNGYVALSGSMTRAASVAKSFGLALKNIAITMAISFAIQGIAVAIKNAVENAMPAAEQIKNLSDSFSDLSGNIEKTAKQYNDLKASSEDLIPRYAELAKGVGYLGNNIGLTDAEYEEFISTQNTLADLFPEISAGIDENGNAIVRLGGNTQEITEQLNGYVEAARKAANTDIGDQIDESFENIKKRGEIIQSEIDDNEKLITYYKSFYSELTKAIADSGKYYLQFDFLPDEQKRAYGKIIDTLGIKSKYDFWKHSSFIDVDALGSNFENEYKALLGSIEKTIVSENRQQANQWNDLIPVISAWLDTGDTSLKFQAFGDDLQTGLKRMLSGIDLSQFDTATQMEEWIVEQVIEPIDAADDDVKQSIADMLSINASTLDYDQYRDYIERLRSLLVSAGLSVDVAVNFVSTVGGNEELAGVNAIGSVLDAKYAGTFGEIQDRYGYIQKYLADNGVDLKLGSKFDEFATQYGDFFSDWQSELAGFVTWVQNLSLAPSSTNISEYITKVKELTSSTDTLKKAQDEIVLSGTLSAGTISELSTALSDYNLDAIDFLYEENGAIKANISEMADALSAAVEAGVSDAYAALQVAERKLAEFSAADYAANNPWLTSDDVTARYNQLADDVARLRKEYSLTKSVANSFKKSVDNISKSDFWSKVDTPMDNLQAISSVFVELSDGNGVSFSSLQKIQSAFADVDGIDQYIATLASAKSNSNEVAQILNVLATSAINNAFSTEELASANEDVVASMLREVGVANSEEVAHQAIASAKEASAYASRVMAASTEEEREAILKEAETAGFAEQYIAALTYQKQIMSLTTISTSGDITNLQALAKQAGITGEALIRLQTLRAQAETLISTKTFTNKSGNKVTVNTTDSRAMAANMARQQKAIDDAKKQAEDVVSSLADIPTIDFSFDGGENSATAAEKIKSAFDELNTVLEHYISLREAEYNIADRNYDYDGMRTSLERQVEYYQQIQANAHSAAEEIRAYYRSQGLSAEAIEQQSEIMALQDTWIAAADSINSALDRIANAIKEKLSQQIDDVQSAWQALSAAAEEYSNTGTISVDSLQAVIEAGIEYTSLLVDENGQLALNEEAVSAVLEAKTQQLAVETALGYIEEVRNALTQNNTAELARLLDVTTATTSSTWDLVYAQAALLNLNGTQYNQLISNINKFRSVATVAVQSVRKTISKSAKSNEEDYKSALDKILDLTEELIKHEHEDMVDALNDELDMFRKIVEEKKKLLETTRDEQNYEREVAKRLKEIAKIQNQINLLSLDDSREAMAQRAGLETDLAGLQEELSDYISDYTLNANQEVLDKQIEQQEEYTDERIKQIEAEVSSTEKLHALAVARIDSGWNSLYQDLMAWNYEYGSTISDDLTAAWDKASEAVQRYGSFTAAVSAANSASTISSFDDYSSSVLPQATQTSSASNGVIDAFGQRIVSLLQSGGGSHIYNASNNKAQPGDIVITNGGVYRKTSGASQLLIGSNEFPTYVGSGGNRYTYDQAQLYDLLKQRGYIYHNGGFVGAATRKQNEEIAILQDGELVATEKMQDRLFSMVDFVDSVSKKLKALPYANGITSLLSNNVVSGLQALKAPVAASTNNSMVFEPHIEVTINHNGDMTDGDLRGYGEKIADATLGKLAEAFQKRGVRNISAAMLR